MKENYLWDKTGEDPEIERLENLLSQFRYRETAPPALPAKIIPFKRKSPRGFFRLAFAFAAFAALTVVCLGVWFQFSSVKIETAKNSTETPAPQVAEKISGEVPVSKPADFIISKVEAPKQSAEQKFLKVRKAIPVSVRPNKLIARNVAVVKPAVKLTKRETYAYDQLMLALAITSSKLKLVTDKIDGVETKNTNVGNER